MADVLELDPVGVGERVAAVTLRLPSATGSSRSAVPQTTRTGHSILRRVERGPPRMGVRLFGQWLHSHRRAGDAEHQVGDQLRRNVLVARRVMKRGCTPAADWRGEQRRPRRVGRRRAAAAASPGKWSSVVAAAIRRQPASRPQAPVRRPRRARPRTASCSARVAAQRIAHQVRRLDPRLVEGSCSRASSQHVGRRARARRAAVRPRAPANVSAITSCWRSSAGSTSSHVRQVSVKPCRHTSGGPEPPRCRGVKEAFTGCRLVNDRLTIVLHSGTFK